MKYLLVFFQYLKSLIILWIIGAILLVLDILGAIERFFPDIEIGDGILLIVFTILFFLANIIIFTRQNVELSELRELKPEILMELDEARLTLYAQEVQHENDRLLPSLSIKIFSRFSGFNTSQLITYLDMKETKLPSAFKVIDYPREDEFNPLNLKEVHFSGPVKLEDEMEIRLGSTKYNNTLIDFVNSFTPESEYEIVIKYYTLWYEGGKSKERELALSGNLRDLCFHTLDYLYEKKQHTIESYAVYRWNLEDNYGRWH